MLFSDGVPFAIDAEGIIRDVEEVERGLKCHCVCADCKSPVIARQGDIRVHHFAHADRRECRHAAEAALFAMIVKLVAEKRIPLQLPGLGDRRTLLPNWEQFLSPTDVRLFAKSTWILKPEVISTEGVMVNAGELGASNPSVSEFAFRERAIEVHLLSYRKRNEALEKAIKRSTNAVLAIDLEYYLRLWWKVCDERKEERINAVSTATELMIRWLSQHTEGRHWLQNPTYDKNKLAFERWLRERQAAAILAAEEERKQKQREEQQRQAAEAAKRAEEIRISMDPGWSTPAWDSPEYQRSGYTLVAFVKPIKLEETWITSSIAREYGLVWDAECRRYVYNATKPSKIPTETQQFMIPSEPWQPRYAKR